VASRYYASLMIHFTKTWMIAGALILGVAPAIHGQHDSRAEGIITRWIDAAGGPRVWDAVRDVRYTITTVWFDSTGSVEVRRRPRFVAIDKRAAPYRVRVERTEAEGRYIQIWSRGAFAWLNGKALPDTGRAVREVEYVAGDLTYWIGLPWKLRDPGVNLTYQEENGVPVVHVSFGRGVGLHDGDRFWYYWHDGASPFPTEVHYIEQDRTERVRVALGERTRIGTATFFARRTIKSAQGIPVRALIISDVVVNRGIPPSTFKQ
jgi:hypothetical protein